jgi:serine phosphatase RsbU (regulator of sigma subunit)
MSSPTETPAGALTPGATVSSEADPDRETAARRPKPGKAVRARPSAAAIAALLTGLVVTAALSVTALVIYNRNEDRLLGLRVHELGLVLAGALPSIQTPLASAAELADATDGNPQKFRAFMAEYVGPGRKFASASLLPVGVADPKPTVVAGSAPILLKLPAQAKAFLKRSEQSTELSVTGILGSASPRLGYEFNTPGSAPGFAAYAESPLPASRRSALASSSGFSDLYYALYLGHTRSRSELLLSNIPRFPKGARTAWIDVPFGDSAFTLVVTPNGSLGGTFFRSLPWIIAILGAVISLLAALMTDRLARGRRHAQELAGVLDEVATANRRMYTEQRSIAQTLQQALLPDALPSVGGLEVSARYVPAGSGIDVGGDWYDIVAAGERGVLLVIGDVSGHGLTAATTMASLRHAALAYAVQDCQPATVLNKLSSFVNSGDHEYLATVLCALVDVDGHRLTVASAGHPGPLLIEGEGGRFLQPEVGLPIGVPGEAEYREVSVAVAPRTTLVAFTDGLVERREEVLDTGLRRLREAATARHLKLDDLVATLARDVPYQAHNDDTAIVGIRWRS